MVLYNKYLNKVYSSKNTKEVIRNYDKWAQSYDHDVTMDGYNFPSIISGLTSEFIRNKKTKILDAGCGTGLIAEKLHILGYSNFYGIDFSSKMLSIAKKRKIYKNLKKVDLNKDIPFKNNFFDTILCIGVFTKGHVGSSAIDEILRVLKINGILILSISDPVLEKWGFRNKLSKLKKKNIIKFLYRVKKFAACPNSHKNLMTNVFVYKKIDN